MSNRRFSFHWLPVLLIGVALVTFTILVVRYQRKPVIIHISQFTAKAGDRIELKGQFFGNNAADGKLIFGKRTLASTGIIEWSDDCILAQVPKNDGAVLVKVKTRSGMSNGVIMGDATRFPQVVYGSWMPGTPYVKYAEPSSGGPGTQVTLLGNEFGIQQSNGSIWVNRTDTSMLLGRDKPDLDNYMQVEYIDIWTDSKIRFRMPTGAASGYIYIFKGGKFSNPIHFDMLTPPGTVTWGPPILWSIRQTSSIAGIGALPGNALYLRLPNPAPGLGQSNASITGDNVSNEITLLREDTHLAVYRLDELKNGEKRQISRQIVVQTTPVKIQIESEKLETYDATFTELEDALITDEWIRPEMVSRTAKRLVNGMHDDWNKSRAIYNHVLDTLTFSKNPPAQVFSDYSANSLADSQGYSFLFCSLARAVQLPARPVGGILVDDNDSSHRWWWAEVWIEGWGWVPLDPALGDAADVPLTVNHNAREYYMGGLEGRHIAFSRGIKSTEPMQPNTRLRSLSSSYSLQSIWEETSGNILGYTCEWDIPHVMASYQ